LPARRFAPYRQSVGAELFLTVLYQPSGSSLAIVRTRRVGVLRRQPIFDADNGLTRVVGDPLQHRILHVRAAQHPAAAVEMQINPARLRRCDHPQGDFVAVLARDGQISRPARHHRGRERAFAAPARGPESLGADDPPLRLVGQQLDHLNIQFRRFGIDRRFAEQS
jgi:hypothetical protein